MEFHCNTQNIFKNSVFFCARGPPQFLKRPSENAWANEQFFMRVAVNSRNRNGSCSENWGFRIAQVVRRHSENGISHSENRLFSQLRELLREYPGTLPELRDWPFRSESVFPEIGVVSRLLMFLRPQNRSRLKPDC